MLFNWLCINANEGPHASKRDEFPFLGLESLREVEDLLDHSVVFSRMIYVEPDVIEIDKECENWFE